MWGQGRGLVGTASPMDISSRTSTSTGDSAARARQERRSEIDDIWSADFSVIFGRLREEAFQRLEAIGLLIPRAMDDQVVEELVLKARERLG